MDNPVTSPAPTSILALRIALVLTLAACSTGTQPEPGDPAAPTNGDPTPAPGDEATPGDAPPPGDQDLGPVGTLNNPIAITAFPFTDTRDTNLAPGPGFDRYECSPEADEAGDAFVYVLTVPSAGTLEARVDDAPGGEVDVDLHLLTALDPAACSIRDNIAISYAITPGTHYLIVDTWVDDTATPLAGPYTLDVDFTPTTPVEEPIGSAANPILIDGFPFSDGRDTSLAPAAQWDSYACAPTVDEGGGEYIYVVYLDQAGTLTATVDDLPTDAVDVDLHLLGSLDPTACVARDNVSLSEWVNAGTHYLAVDTWVDGNGDALAGPYLLSVDFVPDIPGGDPAGSLANPILVDSFPFQHAANTEIAPSDLFDSYACAPDTNESGGEVIYQLELSAAGILKATLDDVSGDETDVDLHLMSAPDPATCLTRGNTSFAYALPAGTHYLTADTWVSSTGTSYAGAYLLTLELVPSPDLASGCVIIYGDTRGATSDDPQVAHQAVMAAMDGRCGAATFVHTGDLVRSGSSAADWQTFRAIEGDFYAAADRPLYPTRGNHDGPWSTITSEAAPLLSDPLPDSTYLVPLAAQLDLIVLDSETDTAAQATWLAAELSDPTRTDHVFLIALHRPLYPSLGGHGGYADGVADWMPILRDYAGRSLVVSGHNHALSREWVDGVSFFTSGGGGAPLYGCTQVHAGTRYCARSHGYLVCDTSLTCVAYEVDAETGQETLADAFTVADAL